MKRTCSCSGSGRHTHHYISLLSPSPMCFRQVVNNLVKSFGNKICKLHFNHRLHSLHGQTQSSTNNGCFADWCVAYTGLSEFIYKPLGDFKGSTILGNVLTH